MENKDKNSPLFSDHKSWDEEEEEENEPRRSSFAEYLLATFDFIKTVVVVIILALIIRLFIIQPFIVEGQSMEPSFKNNDYLITEKITYKFRAPERGEVIIFHPPGNPSVNYIKRVVGLPGDTITIQDGSVYINGKQILEPYLNSNKETKSSSSEKYTLTLKENEYYVLGDNRTQSRDSRELGPIPSANIVSRIWVRLLPLSNIKAFAAVNYQTVPSN
jgi:signal peptidase I